MEKTFEQFKQDINSFINTINESKPRTGNGMFIIERMAKFHDGDYAFAANLYYRWIRVTDMEVSEMFHRNKFYWRILFDKERLVFILTNDGVTYRSKDINSFYKYLVD